MSEYEVIEILVKTSILVSALVAGIVVGMVTKMMKITGRSVREAVQNILSIFGM